MKTILCIGELLIDFLPDTRGTALRDVVRFERAAGGAPGNVACAVAKLGGRSRMLAMVGRDAFGDHLIGTLADCGVDTRFIRRTGRANTALAFVSLDADGNRDFSFYRNPSADLLLSEDDLAPEAFEDCGILHFGSVDLVDGYPVREAHSAAVEAARAGGALISFDPNIRLPLWDSPGACRDAVRAFLPLADIVKLADDELAFVTGEETMEGACRFLFDLGCRLAVVTRGPQGADAFTPALHVHGDAPAVPVADTTGAGDAFIGALLFQMLRNGPLPAGLAGLEAETLREWLDFANRYAARTTMKKGAIAAMPTTAELALACQNEN